MLDPHSITLTREEARTAIHALYSHETRCNDYADACMARRSSDRTYEQNVHDTEAARPYRRIAGECLALRMRIIGWLDATAGKV
jgi:hypothetical protein